MWSKAPRCEVSLIDHTTSVFIRQIVDSHRLTRVRSLDGKNGLNELQGRSQTRDKDHLVHLWRATNTDLWRRLQAAKKAVFVTPLTLTFDASQVKSKLPAYWTTPLSSFKGACQSQSCYVFDFNLYQGQRSKQRSYIFDFTFDAGKTCSKSNFLSFGFTRQYKVVINPTT